MPQTLTARVRQVGPSTSEGRVRSHTVLIDRPEVKGGDDQGAMGGELLLLALGGCFLSHLLAAIRARDAGIRDVIVVVNGTLDGAPERFVDLTMTVAASCDDPQSLAKLVTVAERSCQVLNTLRQSADVSIFASPS